MKKAVVYTSTTGNTEAMANAIAKGVEASGAELLLATADSADKDAVLSSDVIILGCPAMGAEEVEEQMEEFYTAIEGSLSGKKVALFGSYDWGDGEWLRTWGDRVKASGATLINGDGLIGHLSPDADCIAACEELGKSSN